MPIGDPKPPAPLEDVDGEDDDEQGDDQEHVPPLHVSFLLQYLFDRDRAAALGNVVVGAVLLGVFLVELDAAEAADSARAGRGEGPRGIAAVEVVQGQARGAVGIVRLALLDAGRVVVEEQVPRSWDPSASSQRSW